MSDTTLIEDEEELVSLFRTIQGKLSKFRDKHGGIYRGAIQDGTPVRMPAHLMKSCRAVADRVDILAALPKGGKVAEIGNFGGDFSVSIIKHIQPAEYHTFDHHLDRMKPENRAILDEHGACFYHQGDPMLAIPKFPDKSFDLIYLNRSKYYAGVWAELTEALRLLRPNGHLMVNDYTAWDPVQCKPYGVLPAVTDFAIKHKLEAVYISLHGRGFLNIALRRVQP
jgi:ubiquinone/menaquinone biosynthesis C-methylase UbiE